MSNTRYLHIEWCKLRALKILESGDVKKAFESMVTDLGTNPETAGHPRIAMGTNMLRAGMLDNPDKMRNFIDGIN